MHGKFSSSSFSDHILAVVSGGCYYLAMNVTLLLKTPTSGTVLGMLKGVTYDIVCRPIGRNFVVAQPLLKAHYLCELQEKLFTLVWIGSHSTFVLCTALLLVDYHSHMYSKWP